MREHWVEEIHGRSLEILRETGLFIPDEMLLRRFGQEGFPVDMEKKIIRVPPDSVEKALKSLVPGLTLYGREGRKLGFDGKTKFMTSGTGVAIQDGVTRERRDSTAKDVENLVRIQDALKQVDLVRSMVTATDYPAGSSDLVEFYLLFKHTTKPFFHRTLRPENASVVMEMARIIAGSSQALLEKPNFGVIYCPISPLSFAPEALRSVLHYAEGGIPVVILSMAMGGATAPATLIGELFVINAEILGTVTLIKSLFPRAPLLYGSVSSVLDMKTGILALGAPERGILNFWCSKLARRYGLPSMMGGLSTDARDSDAQAGFEKALTAFPLLGEADIIFGMGVVDSANSYSYEQLVLDDEFVSALKRVKEGWYPLDGTEEFELIQSLGPKKDYLGEMHTVRHFRENWSPSMFHRGMGEKDYLITRANKAWKNILSDHAPEPTLDPRRDEALIRLLRQNLGKFPI